MGDMNDEKLRRDWQRFFREEREKREKRYEARSAQARITGQIRELLKSRPLPAQPDEIETSAPSWADLGLRGEAE